MSRENVDLVAALQPAPDVDLVRLFREDERLEDLAPFFHDDLEVLRTPPLPSSEFNREPAIGLAGLKRLWLDWLEPWEAYRTKVEEIIDAGDKVVVHGRAWLGTPVQDAEFMLRATNVWTVRDAKISRVAFFLDRDAALADAGLGAGD